MTASISGYTVYMHLDNQTHFRNTVLVMQHIQCCGNGGGVTTVEDTRLIPYYNIIMHNKNYN